MKNSNGLSIIAFCFAIAASISNAATSDADKIGKKQTAVDLACKVADVKKEEISSLNDKYKSEFDKLKNETDRDSKNLHDESNGEVGINGHIETRRFDFSIDIPQVTNKPKTYNIDIPETSIKEQDWSYDTISLEKGESCSAGPDVLRYESKTCKADLINVTYECGEIRTVRGPDICFPTLTAKKITEHIKLGIPETRMVANNWVINTPEVAMRTEKFSFDYPVFIVDDVKAKASAQQKKSEELSKKSKAKGDAIATEMRTVISDSTKSMAVAGYNCQIAKVSLEMRKTYNAIKGMSEATKAGYDKALTTNNPDVIAAYKKSTDALEKSRRDMLINYVRITKEASKQFTNTIEKLK